MDPTRALMSVGGVALASNGLMFTFDLPLKGAECGDLSTAPDRLVPKQVPRNRSVSADGSSILIGSPHGENPR